jgi:hypothetical protein
MNDAVFWIIIALFYLPLHYAIPLVAIFFMHSDDPIVRKQRMIATAIDCTISATIAFTLVIWLAADRLQMAMLILMLSMALPYIRIPLQRRRSKAMQAE